ncbi:MAG: class I SAM-dependent methyltransferase [Ferrovibrio sp.]|uniref:class I SAM-dependent methyltransferase n=1 Tax=Ferrovibrio sp. TaxID=1917215 RepID=UPI00262474B1|nr:class I SAM-dependent methyltransferase [Ferrovibrio sp.]MCW0234579.1 class I SAM-dependent methyltransferase [Ferrovibrio sp.]
MLSRRAGADPEADDAAMQARIAYDTCPLCRSDNFTKIVDADCSQHPLYQPVIPPVMHWMACGDCGHVFTDGYFTDEAAAVIFSRVMEYQAVGWEMEKQRAIFSRIVERVSRHVADGVWLDIGFGNGSLLFTAAEYGFTPVGADLRQDNTQALIHAGIEGHCIDITKFDQQGRFSVISMADVLEHMPFPREGLAAAHRLLNDDGILFLSMPNADCPLWRNLNARNANPYWGELEHFHNFGRPRLYRFLEESGFRPVHYTISERYRVGMEIIARRVA